MALLLYTCVSMHQLCPRHVLHDFKQLFQAASFDLAIMIIQAHARKHTYTIYGQCMRAWALLTYIPGCTLLSQQAYQQCRDDPASSTTSTTPMGH